jgi:hydroxymethylglutaryl-CoA synthase
MGFHVPHYFLDLASLAELRGIDPDKFYLGIGQERMAVTSPDEDVVTMAANASVRALIDVDRDAIETVIFATESGIDQSKAAAIYVHQLLGLSPHCKSFEIKQACCGSTAGVQMAQAYVAMHPDKKVLVVASDVARYDLASPGEATQGAGAVAMVISSEPHLLALDSESGSYTEDVMDFWRPNYREEACVDGKYSIKVYLNALAESWQAYVQQSHRAFGDFTRFCYHLPFTRMAEKAHRHLVRIAGDHDLSPAEMERTIGPGLAYSRITGNAYSASLYVGLTSMLDTEPTNLAGQRLGLFSYGSGCMGSFFSGVVGDGYRARLDRDYNQCMLENRTELDCDQYKAFYDHALPRDGSDYRTARHQTGLFRLAGVSGHKRLYEACPAPVAEPAPAALAASV